jgi:hypothetical protein
MDMEELKILGSGAGAVTAIVACAAVLIKPFRSALTRILGINKAQQAMLRTDITNIYYTYLSKKELPVYVKENLILLNDAYVAAGGNSFVCAIVRDMMAWEVSNI